MKRIVFYLENKGISSVDCSNIALGNPGIGGIEYKVQALVYFLTQIYSRSFQYELYAQSTNNLPQGVLNTCVNDVKHAIKKAVEQNMDYFVLPYVDHIDNALRVLPSDSSLKIILWAGHFMSISQLNKISKCKRVIRIVCVGYEQLDSYRDHQAFYKSAVIYNGLPIESYIQQLGNVLPLSNRLNTVTYVGSLIEAKGFHLLAKAWPKVVEQVPDAHLNVIGSGKVYNRTSQLGKWGIAEESYEKLFMPYLLDETGKIHHSVKFWGVLGTEKFDVLKQTKVGVPNPSGLTETFCITALEMQLAGALVTTIQYGGFMDTVYTTGLLYKNTEHLAAGIITQLAKKDNDYEGCLHFIKNNFSYKNICKKWIDLFESIERGDTVKISPYIYKKGDNRKKYIYELSRKLKETLPFGKYLPSLIYVEKLLKKGKKLLNMFLKNK